MIKQPSCPLCLCKNHTCDFLASSRTYKDVKMVETTICVCEKCGAYYLKEYVDESNISQFYPDTYYTKLTSNTSTKLSFKKKVRLFACTLVKGYPQHDDASPLVVLAAILYSVLYFHRWNRFPKYNATKSSPTALEIGYGAGDYLIDLKTLGWKCFGIDVEQSNASRLRKHGIVVGAKFYDLKIADGSIDYIYSYHAFEHIYDIENNFCETSRVLSNDGVFKLCVPVSSGFVPRIFRENWYDLGVPIHKQIFTLKGIDILAKRHGLEIKQYRYASYGQSIIGSIYALIISKIGSKKTAQHYDRTLAFKIFCFLISPLVLFVDLIGYGDRIEVDLIKRKT